MPVRAWFVFRAVYRFWTSGYDGGKTTRGIDIVESLNHHPHLGPQLAMTSKIHRFAKHHRCHPPSLSNGQVPQGRDQEVVFCDEKARKMQNGISLPKKSQATG